MTACYEDKESGDSKVASVKDLTQSSEKLAHDGWKATAGSEENAGNDGPASWAIDGNTTTIWHSKWSSGGTHPDIANDQNNEFTIDFGQTVTVNKFEYVPRSSGISVNGIITKYKLLYSTTESGDDFKELTSGEWDADKTVKTATFAPTEMRRIQIRALATLDDTATKNQHVTAAEFNAYKYVANTPVMIDTDALWNAVLAAQDKDLSIYTDATAKAYQDALDAAKAKLALELEDDMTQEQVDNALAALTAAEGNLEKKQEVQYAKLTGLTGVADSQELTGEPNGNGPAAKALDGKADTYWHTNWKDGSAPKAKTDGTKLTGNNNYIITLAKPSTVTSVTYLPRNGYESSSGKVNNGAIEQCNVYVTTDGTKWTLAGTIGEGNAWNYVNQGVAGADQNFVEKTVTFDKAYAGVTKVKVEAIKTAGPIPNQYINAAEFGVIGKEDTETPGESAARKALAEALKAAAKVEAEDNYTAESYAVYETALAAANAITEESTDEEVQAADALNEAIDKLVKCTCALSKITGVEDVISITLEATEELKEVTLNPQVTVEGDCQANHNKENIQYSYDIISGNDVIKVENGKITTLKESGTATIKITASLKTINNKKITQEKEITVKVTTKKATAQEKKELNTQVTEVEAQYPSGQYDADDYQAMSDAIKNAKELLNKSTASKEEIENAKTAITNASRDLAQLKDTYEAEIRTLHEEIGKFNENHYTTESWKNLTDADTTAMGLLSDTTTPTPKQLKEAATELSKATDDLVVQHTYDVTWDWTWNEEKQTYTAAKATLKCKYCDEEQKNLTGTVNITTTDATCTEAGEITYTASVEFNGKTYTDEKKVTIPATGHTYGKPEWNWEKTEEGYKATATFKCSKCEEGTEGHQVIVEAAKVEMTGEVAPGCETKGSKTYKATVTFNGESYDNTETEEVAALGHKLTKTAAKAATCTAAGNSEYYTCSECGKYFSDAAGKNEIAKDSWVIKAKGHTITKKETPATADKEGKIEYSCDVCKDYVEKTFVLPKTETSVYMGKTANLISDASKCSITLANAKKYKKYFTLDTKTGKIKTSTKKLSKVKIKKTIPVKVTVDGKAYNVNVKLKIAAPKIKIKRKKIVIGGVSGYRYELQYNIKGATRVKIRVKKMSVLNKKFDANMSKPKSSKSRCYINASSSGLKKLGNKLTFEIVAYYGKNVSQKFIKRI